jgi:hypothetical protein
MATVHSELYSRLRTLLGDTGEIVGFSNAQLDAALVAAVEEAQIDSYTSVDYDSDGTEITPTVATLTDKWIILVMAALHIIGPSQDPMYIKTANITSWRAQGLAARVDSLKKRLDRMTDEDAIMVASQSEFNEWLDSDEWVDDKIDEDT